MKQIFVPTLPYRYNCFLDTAYTPVLSVPGVLTNVSVSRLTSEIGQIAFKGNIAAAGTHTLVAVNPTDRFLVTEVSVSMAGIRNFAFLDGAVAFVYGGTPVNGQFSYRFGGIGYLSTTPGNDLVIRNDDALAQYVVTVSGYVMSAAGALTRF